jgi:hypothetical protein
MSTLILFLSVRLWILLCVVVMLVKYEIIGLSRLPWNNVYACKCWYTWSMQVLDTHDGVYSYLFWLWWEFLNSLSEHGCFIVFHPKQGLGEMLVKNIILHKPDRKGAQQAHSICSTTSVIKLTYHVFAFLYWGLLQYTIPPIGSVALYLYRKMIMLIPREGDHIHHLHVKPASKNFDDPPDTWTLTWSCEILSL